MVFSSRSSNRSKWTAGAVLAIGLFLSAVANATAELPEVDTAIVLLSDVSRSIDDSEFQLEKHGYSSALADPRVIAAIAGGANGRIAIAYMEFAGEGQVRTVVDWSVIDGASSAAAFAEAIGAAPRSYSGRTAIGGALLQAIELLTEATLPGTRTVIDIAGDGTSNAGSSVSAARDQALAAGICVNGLAIINDHPAAYTFAHVQPPGGLAQWYRENVTGGAGSFVIEVHDFQSFGEAMVRKLLSEVAGKPWSHG